MKGHCFHCCSLRGAGTLLRSLTTEKVALTKLRERDTRASREREKEFIRVPPFVPSPRADKEAESRGRFLPLTPSSSLPPLPLRPLPLPASPAPLQALVRSSAGSVPKHQQLSPDPLSSYLPENFALKMRVPVPSHTPFEHPVFSPRSHAWGKSPNSLFPGDAPLCLHFPCQSGRDIHFGHEFLPFLRIPRDIM